MMKQHFMAYLRICVLACLLLGSALLALYQFEDAQAQGDAYVVTILGNAQPPGYAPALLSIHVYDTVVFVNQSAPAAPYAIIADDGSFSSPAIAPNQQWRFTFGSAGAYEYHDNNAPPRMAGEIVVLPADVPLLPSPLAAAQATAISYIKAGKSPPDTVWQQSTGTPASNPDKGKGTLLPIATASPAAFWLSLAYAAILVIALEAIGFGSIKIGIRVFRLIQARKQANEDEDEDDA